MWRLSGEVAARAFEGWAAAFTPEEAAVVAAYFRAGMGNALLAAVEPMLLAHAQGED